MPSTVINSSIGALTVVVNDDGALEAIQFGATAEVNDEGACDHVVRQLEEYFRGERKTFGVKLALKGTAFQLAVWKELQRVPYGTTISYGQLAERVGHPAAVRAVGAANGANPIPIIIPCHRVIGSNGTLTGYAGGLPIKRKLLDLEQPQASLVLK